MKMKTYQELQVDAFVCVCVCALWCSYCVCHTHAPIHTHTHSKSNETPKHRQGKRAVEPEKREEIECRPCNLQLLPQSIAPKKKGPPLWQRLSFRQDGNVNLSAFFFPPNQPALPKNFQPDAVGQLNPPLLPPPNPTHTHTHTEKCMHAGKVQKKM